MNASILVPAGILASVLVGVVLLVFACFCFVTRRTRLRLPAGVMALLAAFVINSSWLAFLGLAFYKLFILREDT